MALMASEMFSDFKGKFLFHTSSKSEDIEKNHKKERETHTYTSPAQVSCKSDN